MIVDYIKTVCLRVPNAKLILLKDSANHVQNNLSTLTEYVELIKSNHYVKNLAKEENVKNAVSLLLILMVFANLELLIVFNIMLIILVMFA